MAASGSSGSTSTVINRQAKTTTKLMFYILHDTTLSLEEKLEQITELLDGDSVNVNLADDRDGQNTLLHGAVSYGYVAIVRLLLEKGADVSCKNTAEETPLHVAVGKGLCGIVKQLLLKDEADVVNSKNATGDTALHLAAARWTANKNIVGVKLVNLLLKHKADVNIQNEEGKTPLHLAVEQSAMSVVRLLLDNNADANIKAGVSTPLDLAKEKENQEIIALFLSSVVKSESMRFDQLSVGQGNDASGGDRNSSNNEDVVTTDGDASPFSDSNEVNGATYSRQDITESSSQDQARPVMEAYRPVPGTYRTSGAKLSNHGALYQLRLLMYFLLRAMNNWYVFRLGTEVDYADYFDDLVFEYQDKESGVERKLFLQARHVNDDNKTIGIGELLSHTQAAPFSLLKYYKSYLKIKETFGLEADKIDLAICTNIHLRLDNYCKMTDAGSNRQLSFTQVIEPYKELFKVGKCYKLVTDDETLALLSSELQTYNNTIKTRKKHNNSVSEGSFETFASNEFMHLFWDFKTFLNNLIFVVKQPVDDDMIKTELMTYTCMKLKDINVLYDSLYMKIYDWHMKRVGTYLTDELAEDMIQTIVHNLDIVSISGMNKVHAEKLLTSPCAFNASKLDVLLELIAEHNFVHLISNTETKLTAIRVAQALYQYVNYDTGDRYIFIPLSSILMKSTNNLVTKAFKSPHNYDLLVIDIDCLYTSGNELKNLRKDLLRIVHENPNKKIVFIAPKDHPLPAMFNGCTCHYVTSGFQDLTPESQTVLLATSVTLQGERVELSQVIEKDDKDLLDLVSLEAFISDEGLVIGTELPTYGGYDESFYIERSVRHRVHVNAEIFQDMSKMLNDHVAKTESEFQRLCSKHTEANIHWIKEENGGFIWVKSKGKLNALQQYTDRNNSQTCSENEFLSLVQDQKVVIISDTAGMGKSTLLSHISKLIKAYHPGKLVFRVDLNNFGQELKERRSIKSDKSNAMDFLCNKLIAIKTPLEKELLQRKGILLFDGFDEICPEYDDIVIDLVKNINEDTHAQIWITTRTFMRDKLEKELTQFSCSLQPFSKPDTIEFLTKYWAHMHESAVDEEMLKTNASSLVTRLAASINDKEQGFTGIPLQVQMLAECYKDEASESSPSDLLQQFQLVDLYKSFIEKKYYVFFKDKKNWDDSRLGAVESQSMLKDFYNEIHRWYACCLVFTEEKTRAMFPNYCVDKTPVSSLNRIGIVTVVNDLPHFVHRTFAEYLCAAFVMDLITRQQNDEIVDFVLELFASDTHLVFQGFLNGLLRKHMPPGEILVSFMKRTKLFCIGNQVTVERIFYRTEKLFAVNEDKRSALHLAVKHGHGNLIRTIFLWSRNKQVQGQEILRTLLLAKDADGETVLHLATCSGQTNVITTLLQETNGFQYQSQDILSNMLLAVNNLEKNALHLAAERGRHHVIRTLLQWTFDNHSQGQAILKKMMFVVDGEGVKVLHLAARRGYNRVIETLLQWLHDKLWLEVVSKMLFAVDENKRTALHQAATSGHVECFRTLLKKARDILNEEAMLELYKKKDEEGKTALILAVAESRTKAELMIEGLIDH